jgi:trans-AT polyketide synthase/acyltransferase/oxidoreductase domain-containing protein
MGKDLFAAYPDLVDEASDVLGWPVADVCLSGDGRLDQTEFTQPALFVVNALSYLRKLDDSPGRPGYLAGHSLGEFNALHAAGAMDFSTAVHVVAYRSIQMARCRGGGMAAVLGLDEAAVRDVLASAGLALEVAGLNGPAQVAVSGLRDDVLGARAAFLHAGANDYTALRVSGAFHSRHMKPAAARFAAFLDGVPLRRPSVEVISNVTARPYDGPVAGLLARQLTSCVRWADSIRYLLAAGAERIEQIGPGTALTKLVRAIRRDQREAEEARL